MAGDTGCHAVNETPDRCGGNPVQDRAVEPGSEGTKRRPVCSGQREQGGLLPRRAQRDVGIQDGQKSAAGPDGLPPQCEPG